MAVGFGGPVSNGKCHFEQELFQTIPSQLQTEVFVFGMSGLLADQRPLLMYMELFH